MTTSDPPPRPKHFAKGDILECDGHTYIVGAVSPTAVWRSPRIRVLPVSPGALLVSHRWYHQTRFRWVRSSPLLIFG